MAPRRRSVVEGGEQRALLAPSARQAHSALVEPVPPSGSMRNPRIDRACGEIRPSKNTCREEARHWHHGWSTPADQTAFRAIQGSWLRRSFFSRRTLAWSTGRPRRAARRISGDHRAREKRTPCLRHESRHMTSSTAKFGTHRHPDRLREASARSCRGCAGTTKSF